MKVIFSVFIINRCLYNVFVYIISSILLLFCYAQQAFALTFPVPYMGSTVGKPQTVMITPKQTITDIAIAYDIGVNELLKANPGINAKNLSPGTPVIIPSFFKLPEGPRAGIVIDVDALRLFYYHVDENNKAVVSTYPVGVGRQGWSTPQGVTQIISKQKHPVWHPTNSIRREAIRAGHTLPVFIPAGPNSPLGQYAMHLGFTNILIHGTNHPESVGTRASHGCIRMLAADLKELFEQVPIGTVVTIKHTQSEPMITE